MATSIPTPPPWYGTVGVDGIAPIYQPEARWCWWEMQEIYLGPNYPGDMRYVPKVGDFVMDRTTAVTYECIAVDPITLISTLVIKKLQAPPEADEDDQLLSVYGYNVNTYRLYYDASVVPHVINIDRRLFLGGSDVSYVKIFRGVDISPTGQVISMQLDSNGQFLSENVQIELADIDSHTNHCMWTTKEAYTTENLINGDNCTAVVYSDAGHVVSVARLRVVATSFIRDVTAGTKYVSHISIDSPFLSQSSQTTLEFPMNIPVQAMNLTGLVHYSDGSVVRHPVDGVKFSVLGLNTYVATQPGQTFPIVARYQISPGEQAVGSAAASVTADNKYVAIPMTLKTLVQDGAYTVKLFGYPVWINDANGYRMDWWLYNLDRTVRYNVTPFVTINSSVGAFDPKAYGILQRISVSINLQQVSASFKPYIHTQTLDVVLRAAGSDRTTNWSIGFDPSQTPPYGMNVHACAKMINSNSWLLKVSSDLTTQAAWLDRLYYDTKPIYDKNAEIAPVVPTHFAIVFGSRRYEYPISQWNQTFNVDSGLAYEASVYIQFIKRTVNNDIELAIAGMIVWDDMTLS